MTTDRTSAAIMSWCPVHGSAACPEDYMLNRSGEPWSHYADHWDESMRCGLRLHAVQVGWWYEDDAEDGALCWSSNVAVAPSWAEARNVRPAYDMRVQERQLS